MTEKEIKLAIENLRNDLTNAAVSDMAMIAAKISKLETELAEMRFSAVAGFKSETATKFQTVPFNGLEAVLTASKNSKSVISERVKDNVRYRLFIERTVSLRK